MRVSCEHHRAQRGSRGRVSTSCKCSSAGPMSFWRSVVIARKRDVDTPPGQGYARGTGRSAKAYLVACLSLPTACRQTVCAPKHVRHPVAQDNASVCCQFPHGHRRIAHIRCRVCMKCLLFPQHSTHGTDQVLGVTRCAQRCTPHRACAVAGARISPPLTQPPQPPRDDLSQLLLSPHCRRHPRPPAPPAGPAAPARRTDRAASGHARALPTHSDSSPLHGPGRPAHTTSARSSPLVPERAAQGLPPAHRHAPRPGSPSLVPTQPLCSPASSPPPPPSDSPPISTHLSPRFERRTGSQNRVARAAFPDARCAHATAPKVSPSAQEYEPRRFGLPF